MNDLHPIFSDCCGSDSPMNLDAPFVIGSHVYASNNCIVVRCPHNGGALPPTDNRREPFADQLGWPSRDGEQAEPLPDVGSGEVACEVCNGKRFHDGYECEECDGTGFYGDHTPVWVGPILLMSEFVARLRRHGVTTVRPITLTPAIKSHKPAKGLPAAYFKAADFEGLLMGMNPEIAAEHVVLNPEGR